MAKIPKVIHTIWVGPGKMNETMEKCMKSWSKVMPDYEIKFWNEDNIDLDICPYVRDSYDGGHWCHISDYFRYKILLEQGGIYMDTDVEVLKPFDTFLDNEAFATFKKARSIFGVSAAVLGAAPGFKMYKELMEVYNKLYLYSKTGKLNICTSSKYLADAMENLGVKLDGSYQCVNGLTMYPMDYLSPEIDLNGNILVSENTHAIHYYCNSWITPEVKEKIKEAYNSRKDGQIQLKLEDEEDE